MWQPMVAQRWRAQPAFDMMHVGPLRQFQLLARRWAQPRVSVASLSAEFDFLVELKVGDMAPAVAKPTLDGGWRELGSRHGFEDGLSITATFPELELLAPPQLSSFGFDWDGWPGSATLPTPLDEVIEFRMLVQRRSDHKAAVLFQGRSALSDWQVTSRHWWSEAGAQSEDQEHACIELPPLSGPASRRHFELRPPPPWVQEPTSERLRWEGAPWRGGQDAGWPQHRYGLEARLYWAGPAGRWGGESRRELTIEHLARVCHWSNGGRHSTGITLADLETALKAPACSKAALRWV